LTPGPEGFFERLPRISLERDLRRLPLGGKGGAAGQEFPKRILVGRRRPYVCIPCALRPNSMGPMAGPGRPRITDSDFGGSFPAGKGNSALSLVGEREVLPEKSGTWRGGDHGPGWGAAWPVAMGSPFCRGKKGGKVSVNQKPSLRVLGPENKGLWRFWVEKGWPGAPWNPRLILLFLLHFRKVHPGRDGPGASGRPCGCGGRRGGRRAVVRNSSTSGRREFAGKKSFRLSFWWKSMWGANSRVAQASGLSGGSTSRTFWEGQTDPAAPIFGFPGRMAVFKGPRA